MTLLAFPARAPFRGTAVLVPPWKIARAALVGRYTDLLAREGLDVWLLVPPEHMQRAARGTHSGHGFAALDLARFRALFEQLVIEIRTAIAMASGRGAVAVVGLSIGALASSFAIAGREQPELAALIAPPADLAEVLSRTAIGRRYRALAERAGSRWPDGRELARTLAPFDPRRLAAPRSRLFVAVGRHDAIALPAPGMALAAAWGVAPRVYPRGHLTLLFCCRALRGDLRRFCAGPLPRTDVRRRAGQAGAGGAP
jgi:hypothetical protein